MIDAIVTLFLALMGLAAGIMLCRGLHLRLKAAEEIVVGASLAACLIPFLVMTVHVVWNVPPSRLVVFVVSLIILLASLLAARRDFASIKSALIAFTIIALVYTLPILKNFDYWGIHDWDQHFHFLGTPRQILLTFHQLPLWNPYFCGGYYGFADAQTQTLSPQFLITLLFGTIIGTKIAIILYLIFGLLGMFLLSKKLEFGKYSSYLPPIVFMLTSIYSLHLTQGHSNWVMLGMVPWVFLYYLKSEDDLKNTVICGLLLSLLYLGGNTHHFLYVTFALACLTLARSLTQLSIKPVAVIALVLAFAFLLGAIKFIPSIDFSMTHPRDRTDTQDYTPELLMGSLLNRESNGVDWVHPYPGGDYSWHEYGAYIGYIPIALALLGFLALMRKRPEFVFLGIASTLLILGLHSPIVISDYVKKLPAFNTLHTIANGMFLLIFSMAISAAAFLSFIENRWKWTKYVV
ncbi:MAG: hypothetical protein NTU61_04430, partial [Candidatus Altiarchaeota archaeon]|nr:hypothetical protein [Candidatus Altiarchaeota archaeon]